MSALLKAPASSRHSVGDGRGKRDIYRNGEIVKAALEADTAEGWVLIKDAAGTRRLNGRITVLFKP